MKINGKEVIINGIMLKDSDIQHKPCQDSEGNIYLPMVVTINNSAEIYYMKIPKLDTLPVVEIKE